jgi:hypothetical protein
MTCLQLLKRSFWKQSFMGKEPSPADTKARLLAAAGPMFAARGYHATSIRHLAARATGMLEHQGGLLARPGERRRPRAGPAPLLAVLLLIARWRLRPRLA